MLSLLNTSPRPVADRAYGSVGQPSGARVVFEDRAMVKIQLGGNGRGPIRGYMLVDEIDTDLVQYAWRLDSDGYARMDIARKTILAHRMIVERVVGRPLTTTDFPDHVRSPRTDNRRSNLRLATPLTNTQYRVCPNRNNTSGHRGVTWFARNRKWRAQVGYKGKCIFCGYHDRIEDAVRAAEDKRRELGFPTENSNV